jgi:hypothetical protein
MIASESTSDHHPMPITATRSFSELMIYRSPFFRSRWRLLEREEMPPRLSRDDCPRRGVRHQCPHLEGGSPVTCYAGLVRCLSHDSATTRPWTPIAEKSQLGLSDNVNFVLSLRTPTELCIREYMKSVPIHSTAGFIWPSLTLLFSLLAGAGCVVVLAYALLLVVEF